MSHQATISSLIATKKFVFSHTHHTGVQNTPILQWSCLNPEVLKKVFIDFLALIFGRDPDLLPKWGYLLQKVRNCRNGSSVQIGNKTRWGPKFVYRWGSVFLLFFVQNWLREHRATPHRYTNLGPHRVLLPIWTDDPSRQFRTFCSKWQQIRVSAENQR